MPKNNETKIYTSYTLPSIKSIEQQEIKWNAQQLKESLEEIFMSAAERMGCDPDNLVITFPNNGTT